MDATAKLKYAKITPRKARLVVELIRGRMVEEARNSLTYMPNKGAKIIGKLLDSAIANAEEAGVGDVDDLFISRIFVDQGPAHKRYRARAMGRAGEIKKRLSHITIAVSSSKAEKEF